MARFNIQALPKISLHDHLDGGLRPQTIIELADAVGHKLPADTAGALKSWFESSANSGSLVKYLETFDYDLADLEVFQLNAAEGAFQDLEQREELMDMISDGFAEAVE